MIRKLLLAAAGVAMFGHALSAAPAAAEEVNLYSYRQPFLIQPFLDEFTKHTGIKVNVVYAEKGMLERLQAEGRNTPADAVLTVDVARLDALAKAELLQPIHSEILDKNIPAQYRQPDPRAGHLCQQGPGEAGGGHVVRRSRQALHERARLHAIRQARL